MWFTEQTTLVGALGLGVAVILAALVFAFFDVKSGLQGRESFTGNFVAFLVRTAGMNFWHTRAFLIVLALIAVMVISVAVVTLHITLRPNL
jgi:hypothetical protein